MYVCAACVGTVLLLFVCAAVIFQKYGIVLTIWCCLHSVHVNEATVFNSSHAQWQSESTPGFIDQVVLKSPGDFYQVLILPLGRLQRSWVPWDKLQSGSH